MKRTAVIGAGTWGTALGIIAARAGGQVRLWSRNEVVVDSVNRQHVNSLYLANSPLPETIWATTDLAAAVDSAELVLLAAPSHAIRALLSRMVSSLHSGIVIVSATKGIEMDTGLRVSQVVHEVIDNAFAHGFVCLSGPSFAKEVVKGHPTAIVAASVSEGDAQMVQTELTFENLRIYVNDDLVGTELGGSLKNVMAIAAGMVAGLGFGSNSVAALVTRGLAEMTRLALLEGAKLETLMGLAGLGDLVLTCTGLLSRNRFVGQELAKNRSLDEISAGMKEIAEGVKTTQAVKRLASRLKVEMPITDEVYAVLYEGKRPRDAVSELMMRPLRSEFEGRRVG